MIKKPFTTKKSNIGTSLTKAEAESIKLAESVNLDLIQKGETLAKSLLNILDGPGQSIERLAFVSDPSESSKYQALYYPKHRLIPDTILKRLAIQDSLVAAIVRCRQFHVSNFGRPRSNRHAMGFIIDPNPGVTNDMDKETKAKFIDQCRSATRLLSTCGHTKGIDDDQSRESFSQFLSLTARDAVVVGRAAFEIINVDDAASPNGKKFHCFRAVDAGTIYRAAPHTAEGDSVRATALTLLQELAGTRLIPEKYQKGEYAWVQVVHGKPLQAFTANELKCYNFYPVTNIELNGYPLTPLDTVLSAVTTHINITTHNKLYFQSGRASKGMLVIKSDDLPPQALSQLKQQFNNSINSVNNSWRMPVFSCGVEENIQWQPIDAGSGKDAEFQMLMEMNAREIMAAYGMSPDELAGYQHLSRGTASQALSEGNNEFKLEAARDTGIRPLIASFEDMINTYILPLIDPDLATKAQVRFKGLDAVNPEQESQQIVTDSALHMTYDEIMAAVEKEPLGAAWAGTVPLNPAIMAYIDRFKTVGEQKAHFLGDQEALKDEMLAFYPNDYFFQWYQLKSAEKAAVSAAAAPPAPEEEPGDADPDAAELARSVDQAYTEIAKSEDHLPPAKRKLLETRQKTIDFLMAGFLRDAQEATAEIMKVSKHFVKPKA